MEKVEKMTEDLSSGHLWSSRTLRSLLIHQKPNEEQKN